MSPPSFLALLLGASVLAAGCGNPHRAVSEGAFRAATASGAEAELRRLGFRTTGRLACRTPGRNTLTVVRVHCDGRTAEHGSVDVDGVVYDAETSHPRQQFVIRVAGREVLRKPCLGQGCSDR